MAPHADAHIAVTEWNTASPPPLLIDPKELEHIAFSGRQDVAHGIFRSIPEPERSFYANRYVLSEVVAGGIRKLRTFLAASAEEPAADEKAFVDATVRLFITSSQSTGSFPRELFQSVLDWSEELIRLSLLKEALHYYDILLALDIVRFPNLSVRALLGKASVLNMLGRFREAQSILLSLAARPYLIADRNQVPDVLFHLGRESLLKGDITYYKTLLFRGLRHFYTHVEQRRLFVDQIVRTYRRSFRVMLDSRIPFSDRALFTVHRLYFVAHDSGPLRLAGIDRLMKVFVLGYVYCLNYVLPSSLPDVSPVEKRDGRTRQSSAERKKQVLVTRAMGGIGDLLMMTPGFRALKLSHPDQEVLLAIPKRYFPVFEGNSDVTLVDIEADDIDPRGYRRWYNFTDCPAARVETRTAPKVTRDRIEIFARSLGLSRYAVHGMVKRPRYAVLPEERAFQQQFWRSRGLNEKRVIGIQLRSDEVYRDYPHMRLLVAAVARTHDVLLFDAEVIRGYEHERVITVDGLPMRRAFALASACDAIIAPDSSFVHLAAAFDLPCVALFGPINGRLRTRHYPYCRYLDLRAKLGCLPCWRNDQIPCRLTGMRASVCMMDLSIPEILEALSEVLQRRIPA